MCLVITAYGKIEWPALMTVILCSWYLKYDVTPIDVMFICDDEVVDASIYDHDKYVI